MKILSEFKKTYAKVECARAIETIQALFENGQVMEGLARCDELIEKYGNHDETLVIGNVLLAQTMKGMYLSEVKPLPEVIAYYDTLLDTLAYQLPRLRIPEVSALVLTTLLNKGVTLVECDQIEYALTTYNLALGLFMQSDNPYIPLNLGKVVNSKSHILLKQQRYSELQSNNEPYLAKFFHQNNDLDVETEVAIALIFQVQALFELGKHHELETLLNQAIAKYDKSNEENLEDAVGVFIKYKNLNYDYL